MKVFHYDSPPFVQTGFLNKEYLLGRRARHLNPVRMYVLISAVFFLVLYLPKPGDKTNRADDDLAAQVNLRRQLADSLHRVAQAKSSAGSRDSVERDILLNLGSSIYGADTARSEEQSVSMNVGPWESLSFSKKINTAGLLNTTRFKTACLCTQETKAGYIGSFGQM